MIIAPLPCSWLGASPGVGALYTHASGYSCTRHTHAFPHAGARIARCPGSHAFSHRAPPVCTCWCHTEVFVSAHYCPWSWLEHFLSAIFHLPEAPAHFLSALYYPQPWQGHFLSAFQYSLGARGHFLSAGYRGRQAHALA